MIEQVWKTIERYKLLEPGDRVLVGLSGGADSVALVCALQELQERLGLASVRVCHFNHGLRGAESDRDERFAREFCAARGLELTVGQGRMRSLQKPKGESEESWARSLRYAFFEREARPGELVALAHNQNDCAETALFHIARGTGIRGLRGIPPRRGVYIRPLIGVSRGQIEAYCEQNGLVYQTDSTNADIRYARNRIRKNILPELEMINAGAVHNIYRLCEQAREADGYLAREAERLLLSARTENGWDAETLRAADPFLLRYALKQLLETVVRDVDEQTVARAASVAAGGAARTELAPGLFFAGSGGTLSIKKETARTQAENLSTEVVPGVTALPGGVSVSAHFFCRTDAAEKFMQKGLNNCVDCDRIDGKLVLRTRRPGDKFRAAGRGLTKSLKKLFNEAKLPPEIRGLVPVICDETGIVWIRGFGAAERVAAGAGSQKWIRFS